MTKRFSQSFLPGRTIAQPETEHAGREVLRIEAIPVSAGEVVHLRFEKEASSRLQGIWLGTVGELRVAKDADSQFILWSDTAPRLVEVQVLETDGLLRFYNVYEYPPGSRFHRSQMNGSGMLRDVRPDGWIQYSCNDVGVDQGYEKLVFSVKTPKGLDRQA